MDVDRFMGLVDRKLVTDVAKALIEAPSPTGEEAPCAEEFVRILREVGCSASLQTIYENRYNAVGWLRGSGDGPTILLSGHLDTSVRGDEDYLVGKGWKNKAVVEDGRIYGNGIFNMKNAFVSYVAMVDAMQRAGVRLTGDLIIAGTAGEVELAGVDEFQGRRYEGYGMGLRHLLLHGHAADFHILGEPSGLTPLVGMMGTVWAKVTTHGDFAHTAWADSTVNAVEEMWCIWRGLDDWIAKFKRDNEFMDVTPSINRAAIRGGLPWRAARTPNVCSMYIDIRFPPHRFPIDIVREFKRTVREITRKTLRRPVEIEFYLTRPGTLIPKDSPLAQTVANAHRAVTGHPTDVRFGPPFCTDAIDANRVGCPTIVYGAGRWMLSSDQAPSKGGVSLKEDPRAKEGEFVFIDDMVTAAGVYGVACAQLNDMNMDHVSSAKGAMPTGAVEVSSVRSP